MDYKRIFRAAASRFLLGLMFLSLLSAGPAFPLDSEDAQLFIGGFNAYQKKDYKVAADQMNLVLQKYPDTPLRDMALFWLARAQYKLENREEAAKNMATFFRDYPENPLKATVEEDLVQLASAYQRGEKLPPAPAVERQSKEAAAAAEKAAAEKAAAEKAAAEKAAAEKAAAEKAAAEKAAAERAAAERAAAERAAAERAAAERAAEKAEAMRAAVAAAQAAEKAAAEKAAAEKAAAEKAAAEKAAAEKAAAEKAAAEKAAAEKAAAEKAAAEKAAAEKAAAEKAAAEKAAAEKAAAEKAAAEKAAAEKAAAEKAAAEKAAAEKAAAEKAAAEKAAAEKAAAEKAAAEKAAAEKAAAEKAAAEKAAAEKAAAEKAAAEKAAAEKVRVEALRKKAEAEREARDKAQKAKRQPSGSGKQESGEKAALREKAVAEYKDLVTRFPGTAAAAGAAARLREMGVSFDSPVPPQVAAATGNAQVLTLEVGQAADIGFDVRNPQQAGEVSRKVYIPFSVTNRGNGPDSYYLESGFPSAYSAQFAAASRPDRAVNLTPVLAPGESFEGVLSLTVPPTAVDGTKIIYPVKAASQFAREVSQSRDVILVASAPLLRMVLKPDKPQLLPGERVTYRAALLNIGSATATGISIRFNYPPQYEPVDFVPAGFKQEMKAALVMDGLQIKSGEKREYTVQFQLKDEALAQQELFLRGEAVNQDLGTRDSFVSTVSVVRPVSDVLVRSSIGKTMVIPGQVVAIPLIVTNAGNVREDFAIRAKLPERYSHSFFQDMNRDGIRQPNEPVINHVGPLSPREDMYVVMEVSTSATEKDGTEAQLSVDLESENAQGGRASASVRLRFSRPVLELAMAGRGGRLRPGDVNGLELSCMNTGSNMAKNVELESTLPDPVELVASDPPFTAGKGGAYLWRFEELGSGEKRSIKLTYRLKPTAPVGAHLQLKNVLTYQDQLGNRY